MILRIILVLGVCLVGISGQAHFIKFHRPRNDKHPCIIIEEDFLEHYKGLEKDDGFRYYIKPAQSFSEGSGVNVVEDNGNIVEVFFQKSEEAQAFMRSMCKAHEKLTPLQFDKSMKAPEIRKIVDGGDQRNRIDVVFMGDGYTASEREKFFSDMERLTEEMFEGVTFRSYLPVFNIWAIYVESQESGIGYNGPKNTPFRLYRINGQLRAILPGNSQYARQVCALTGTGGCDYPSIIANDDFYGGLGGEFVISTKSNRTGTVVLRHEMGHNFADVGEEYDGGGYSGVNTANSVANLGWSAWLTGAKRAERSAYRIIEWPWEDLSRGPQTYTFTSDGLYSRWLLDLTVSAAGEEDSLEFILDGEILPWKTSGFDDREFYAWHGSEGFSAGTHNLTIRSKTPPTHPEISRMLCSITLHEYGSEDEFIWSPDHVSAYPTYSSRGVTYRPTNEGCLMRNMTHTKFCPVCQEEIWSQFLRRISLIDQVTVSNSSSNGTREVVLETIKLGNFRAPGNEVPGEKLEVKWIRNNQEQPSLSDQFTIRAEPGNWAVEVHLVTPEVRHDPRNALTSTANFVVPSL